MNENVDINPPEFKVNKPTGLKNAYEIRADVLKMAIEWSMIEDKRGSYKKPTDDQLLSLAKRFYDFVQDRR
jgi:hypothetical protein